MKAKHVEEGLVIKHVPTGKFLDDEGELVSSLNDAEEYYSNGPEDQLEDILEAYGHSHGRNNLTAVKIRTTKEEV
jgi:hypothetical protein